MKTPLFFVDMGCGLICCIKPAACGSVEIFALGDDCYYAERIDFRPELLPQWKDRNTYRFSEDIHKLIHELTQVESLQDVPIRVIYGMWNGDNYAMPEYGPRVFLLSGPELRYIREIGAVMPLKRTPVGAKLSSMETCKLFETAFGFLSVDRHNGTFLGEWRIATRTHIRRIMGTIPTHSGNLMEEIRLKEEALAKHLKDLARNSGCEQIPMHEQIMLADAFLGRAWVHHYIEHFICVEIDDDGATYSELANWYHDEFLNSKEN